MNRSEKLGRQKRKEVKCESRKENENNKKEARHERTRGSGEKGGNEKRK